ncbi:MAG: nucleotidyltransferase family protein [Nitrospirae bacterium]|nr:nucleotidyltransferase family protein [Nitrospirota bacterium]
MEEQADYKELLALFNAHDVRYIIVGAYALAFHGAPRYTGDLDLLVRPDEVNGRRILSALEAFGFGSLGLTVDDFSVPDRIIQLGVPPVRVDIITSITGVTWDETEADRVQGTFGTIPVSYIGKNSFIRNKRALGRNKDFADAEALGEDT